MSAVEFLDTNVLVYSYDTTDSRKQEIAQNLVRKAVAGDIVTSTQVLGEFAATLLRKVVPPVAPSDLADILDALGPVALVATDADMVRRAVEVRGRYGLHFYDSLIIAAAERAGCKRIWSEDLNSGQDYFGISAHNPF